MSIILLWRHVMLNFPFFFLSLRATIEEVEGDVCELESKLDKVSTTHGKHCLIVHALHYEPGIFCGDLVKGFMFVPQPISIILPVTQRQAYLCTWLVLDRRIKGPRSHDKRCYQTCRRNYNSIFPSAPSVLTYTNNKSEREHESVPPPPV